MNYDILLLSSGDVLPLRPAGRNTQGTSSLFQYQRRRDVLHTLWNTESLHHSLKMWTDGPCVYPMGKDINVSFNVSCRELCPFGIIAKL